VSFAIDNRSIIPRSLIAEVLAEGMLDAWGDLPKARLLDLCTGNGSLAILAALAWPDAMVEGLDISEDALALASVNRQRHQLQHRIELKCSNSYEKASGLYDLIICNPPYVNQASMLALPPEFRAEPALALAGGEDGMDFVRNCLLQTAQWLQPHGALVLEIGNEYSNFIKAFPTLGGLWLPTSAGDEQVILLSRQDLEILK
jgi:ribosomal protein L3 glutamine methyltransferase